MPAKYEAIRDRLIGGGMKRQEAEKHAAMIYNAKRKKGQPPVTRGSK
jgi:hypothetical protein